MIPNEQDPAKVLVDVLRIARVIHPVCRGRVDHPLKPANAWRQLGVNKELVGQTPGYHAIYPDGILADPHDRQIESKHAG